MELILLRIEGFTRLTALADAFQSHDTSTIVGVSDGATPVTVTARDAAEATAHRIGGMASHVRRWSNSNRAGRPVVVTINEPVGGV